MAAESGGVGLIKVLGEYGVFLVEMGSLQDIYGSLKTMSRIKASFDFYAFYLFNGCCDTMKVLKFKEMSKYNLNFKVLFKSFIFMLLL